MSDCSAWDVTPQNNSGNVKKCKKTPRKNSTAFCRRFPRVQIPLFAIWPDMPSLRHPDVVIVTRRLDAAPPHVRSSARMGFAPHLGLFLHSAKGCQGAVRRRAVYEGNDTPLMPLSGNGGRAAERRRPGAGLVALPTT